MLPAQPSPDKSSYFSHEKVWWQVLKQLRSYVYPGEGLGIALLERRTYIMGIRRVNPSAPKLIFNSEVNSSSWWRLG